MKITKQYLKHLIKEELEKITTEGDFKKGFKKDDFMDTMMNDEETIVKRMLSEPPSPQMKQLIKSKLVNNPKMASHIKGSMSKLPEEYILMIKSGGLGKELQDYYNKNLPTKYTDSSGNVRSHKYATTDVDKMFGAPGVKKSDFNK